MRPLRPAPTSRPRRGRPRGAVRRPGAALLAALALVLAGCAGDDLADDSASGDDTEDRGAVRIVSQGFASATIVTWMYAEVLENAGYEPDVQFVEARDAYMAGGEFPKAIDIVPEYVGAIANFLVIRSDGADAEPLVETDPAAMAEAVAPQLEEAGITLLEPSEATDANAYFVTQEFAEQNDLTTLSDLGELGEPVVLAAAADCEGRADCAAGLSDNYGIEFSQVLPLGFASPQTYEAVLDGEAQVGQTSTIDASLESQGLVLLEDDKSIQPAQNLVPAVSTAFLDDNPEVADLLEELMATLTSEDLTALTARVTVDRERAEDVARTYLADEGLI